MLAAGHVDLVIETELKPYDVLPLIPIIEGAGGVVTTWDNGRPHARRTHHRRRRPAHARESAGTIEQRLQRDRHSSDAAAGALVSSQ